MIPVVVFLLSRKGRKACARTTMLVKFTSISCLNVPRSAVSGLEKSDSACVPAFRYIQSISGLVFVTLHHHVSPSSIAEDVHGMNSALRSNELGNLVVLGDVQDCGLRFVPAVLGDEVVQAVLASSDGCDVDAFEDEAICHCSADAGCGADDKDMFVWKGHGFDGDDGFYD